MAAFVNTCGIDIKVDHMLDSIAVWFSCGAASAVAAKLVLAKYPKAEIRIINNPIAEEDSDNFRFLHDVQGWLGREIETAINPDFPSCSIVDVFNKKNFMSGSFGAPCTLLLKKRARQKWEEKNPTDWLVLGFTAEEENRYKRFILTERSNLIPILIEEKLTKQDCADILVKEGLRLPRIYSFGFPNANCIGCIKATSPTYWNLVRKHYPDEFKTRATQSRQIGKKLVRYQGRKIFLDMLPETAQGRPLREIAVDCGIFCEERH